MALTHLAVVSDVHYASQAEKDKGNDYEYRSIGKPLVAGLIKVYRRWIWLKDPLHQNHLLEPFEAFARKADYVIANGDYSCDTSFVGVSDDAAFQSASECLGRLRVLRPHRFHGTIGDHELGKFSLVGKLGGMRIDSWRRTTEDLGLEGFWTRRLRRYVLVGVASSLIALPTYENETLESERATWWKIREAHLGRIRELFQSISPRQRVILFCHDPTALPFVWREVLASLTTCAIERTIIGHLHTRKILWQSRVLAGMPVIGFAGHTLRRLSSALREARLWRPFNVELCPSLAGVQLFKDGGFLSILLDEDGDAPAKLVWHRVRR